MTPVERSLVLVADDDPDILALVAIRLQKAGYDVLRATDGEQALSLVREQSPALAVLDVMMPKMAGDEVTRQIRAEEATSRTRVILLTAKAQEGDVARGLEAGADEYVTKPFSPQELTRRVAALLHQG